MADVRRLRPWLARRLSRRVLLRAAGFVAGWALVAVPVTAFTFLHDSRSAVLAGHEVTVSPTLDGFATVDLGAYLPNVRYPTDRWIGVHVDVGKTNVENSGQLFERYALIASQPDGEVGKVTDLVVDMLVTSAGIGALVGLTGPALWMLIGQRRRNELVQTVGGPRRLMIAATGTALVITAAAIGVAWLDDEPDTTATDATWSPIGELVPGADIPPEAQPLQVQGGLTTTGTRRLIASAIDTYRDSRAFYREIAEDAPLLEDRLRQPADDETVALLVSDRHDNVGMDEVARAVGDAGGATVLFDVGDDTSTGEEWEAFSLDSLAEIFEDYDGRFVALGNHDEGSFVGDYLAERGFEVLNGDVVSAAGDIALLGVPDPRSSGLGNWRNETGLTMAEQTTLLADTACASREDGDRVSTILVHDASLGQEALERGCVDLVLGGHLHRQSGPDVVRGPDAATGVRYTNGTTGGAAYAFALGSKLRRDAQVTLVTYRDGRPIGLQAVDILTTGDYRVQAYVDLSRSLDPGLALRLPGN